LRSNWWKCSMVRRKPRKWLRRWLSKR
jgi:hypothetical protein